MNWKPKFEKKKKQLSLKMLIFKNKFKIALKIMKNYKNKFNHRKNRLKTLLKSLKILKIRSIL